MSSAIVDLVRGYVRVETNRGLDIGCAEGTVVDTIKAKTGIEMFGIDPRVGKDVGNISPAGAKLLHGGAHDLPFSDSYFDFAILANVYEHIPPKLRARALREINRVLVKGGMLIGQLPNPFFPIEQHSRLPLMGYLPKVVQLRYWKFAPVSSKARLGLPKVWFPVTINDLKKEGETAGFKAVSIIKFGYPADVFPPKFRQTARLLEGIIRAFPFAWQFVLEKR
jgi:SAM-dependent methyltransferase